MPLSQTSHNSAKPDTKQHVAYALPVIGSSFILGPIYLLQGIYAMYFGLSLTTIGTILLISRLFDAITDPLIGHLSDRIDNHRLFAFWGGLSIIISAYFLLVPVDPDTIDASTKVSEAYFMVCFLAFYLTHTFFEIPHLAWGSDLAKTSTEKNSLFAWRSVFLYFGSLLFYVVPFLPLFETREITPHTLQWTAFIGGTLMLLMLAICMRTLPNKGEKKQPRAASRWSWAMFIANKPLHLFLVAYLLTGIVFGLSGSLFFIYVSSYLNQGNDFALVMIVSACASIVGIKCWLPLAARWGKPFTWCVGTGVMMSGIALLAVLTPDKNSFALLLTAYVVIMFGVSTTPVFAPSILSEIIDYSRWKFNTDCSATFFSLQTFMNKANFALGGALGFLVAGWYGFEPSASSHSQEAIFGLRLATIWLPIMVGMLSIVFIALIPINARRHAIIRRYLDKIDKKSASVRPTVATNNIDNSALPSLT